jgi:hypothetical protein
METFTEETIEMLPTTSSFRIDIRPTHVSEFCEFVGRVQNLTPSGACVRSTYQPDPGATVELRLYLPGTDWPLAVERAEVTWRHWDSFSVEFQDARASSIVANYLEQSDLEAA